MATKIWKGGGAPARAQVTVATFTKLQPGRRVALACNNKIIAVTIDASIAPNKPQALLEDVVDRFVSAIGQYSNDVPEWAEISAAAATDAGGETIGLQLTGPADGKPFTVAASDDTLSVEVVEQQKGSAGRNMIQTVQFAGTVGPTGGNYKLTFDGQQTANIAYNASAATVQSALEALSNIASGDVTVTGSSGGPWSVEFTGVYAAIDVPLMTSDGSGIIKSGTHTVEVQTVRQGGTRGNVIHQISHLFASPSGNWYLRWSNTDSSALSGAATIAAVQTEMDTLAGAGNTKVRGEDGGPYFIEWIGKYAGEQVEDLIAYGSAANTTGYTGTQTTTGGGDQEQGGRFVVERVTRGQTGGRSVFSVEAAGAWSFSVRDSIDDELIQGPTVGDNATAKEVAEAFNGVRELAGSVFVGNSDPSLDWELHRGGPWKVTFTNALMDRTFEVVEAENCEVTVETPTAAANEVQRIRAWGKQTMLYSAGDYKLRVDGALTSALSLNSTTVSTASGVQSAINTAIGDATGCTVTRTDDAMGYIYTVTFGNTYAARPVPLIEVEAGTPATIYGGLLFSDRVQEGQGAVNELQRVGFSNAPGGGTFTLTYSGSTTGSIAYDAEPGAVENALQAAGVDAVVSGAKGGPWLVEFVGRLGAQNVAAMTGSSSLTGAGLAIDIAQRAYRGANEVQRVRLLGNPTGGTFTLTHSGNTTGSLNYNASAGNMQAALEALASVGQNNVRVVRGVAEFEYLVEFTQDLGWADASAMTGTSSLTTATATTLTTTTTATGPNHAGDALNWSGGLPTNSDTAVFENSTIDCLYGLEDLSSVTVAELHLRQSFTGSLGLAPHTGQYPEYRARYFKIGATTVYVGQGEGLGSGRLRLDGSTVQSAVNVFDTGQTLSTDAPAFVWKGTHASNVLRVQRGSVGVACESYSDAAALATLALSFRENRENDAQVVLGKGITQLTTASLTGGLVTGELGSITITTLTDNGGEWAVSGEYAATTINDRRGVVRGNSSGTVATLVVGPTGEYVRDRDMRAQTVTNCTIESGATIRDPFGLVTFANPIALSNCGLQDVTLDLGTNVNIQRS